jgi:hypothetical protein
MIAMPMRQESMLDTGRIEALLDDIGEDAIGAEA